MSELRPPLPEVQERISACLPTPREAATLRISSPLPVLAAIRVSTDTTGPVAEAARLLLPGDRADALFTHYTTSGDNSGHVSRLADTIEATQLGMAADLLDLARPKRSETRTPSRRSCVTWLRPWPKPSTRCSPWQQATATAYQYRLSLLAAGATRARDCRQRPSGGSNSVPSRGASDSAWGSSARIAWPRVPRP